MFKSISALLSDHKLVVNIFLPDTGFRAGNCRLIATNESHTWSGIWHYCKGDPGIFCANTDSIIYFETIKSASFWATPPGTLTYFHEDCAPLDIREARKNRNLKWALWFGHSVRDGFKVIYPVNC